MLSGLPLTITKPLTQCVSVCTCIWVCMCIRETVSVAAYLRKYTEVFFMAVKAPVPCIKFTCFLSICISYSDVSGQNEGSKKRTKRRAEDMSEANSTLVWTLWVITKHSAWARVRTHAHTHTCFGTHIQTNVVGNSFIRIIKGLIQHVCTGRPWTG